MLFHENRWVHHTVDIVVAYLELGGFNYKTHKSQRSYYVKLRTADNRTATLRLSDHPGSPQTDIMLDCVIDATPTKSDFLSIFDWIDQLNPGRKNA